LIHNAKQTTVQTPPAGLLDIDSERCPLHLQSNVSGIIAQEAGRPESVSQLFRKHSPAPLSISAVAAPPASARASAATESSPAVSAAASADAAALLSNLSLIDPSSDGIPYD
jgi:hypothetical protein